MDVIKLYYNKSLSYFQLSILRIFIYFFITISNLFFSYNNLYSQNTWLQKTDLGGVGRSDGVSFSIGDKGYYGTGISGANLQDFWEYNQTNDTWTQIANFGGGVNRFAVGFSIGNKGYVGTGHNGAYRKDFWEYNPITNIWTQKTDFGGVARLSAVGFSIGNKGYIGTGNNGSLLQDFWEYNPDTDSWVQKADFGGSSRELAVGFSIKTKGYIGTGFDGSYLKDFWEYNPSSNSWLQKSDLGGLARYSAVGLGIGNKGYIGVGVVSYLTNDFWEYNSETDIWTQKTVFGGSGRAYGDGLVLGTKIYFVAGSDGSALKDLWEYTPVLSPSLNTASISNITTVSANCGGNISFDGRATITSQGIVWDVSPNPTISLSTKTSESTSNTNFSSLLTGLNSGTTYYVRAYATNSEGTSYGDETSFITLTESQRLENLAPNSGDGNGDGIQDSQQTSVHSFLNTYTNNYITIVSLDGQAITSVEIQSTNNNSYYFPANLTKFTVTGSNASIKIYYHGIESLNSYSFKKLNSQNTLFNFTNYTFGSEIINGKQVATATLTLTDGGPEDYDGVVNGSITDPGGPAILASNANIPVWDWRYFSLLFILFGVGIKKEINLL